MDTNDVYASREDVLQGIKALKDKFSQDIDGVKSWQSQATYQLSSLLTSEVHKALQESEDRFVRKLKEAEGRFAHHLNDLEDRHTRHLQEVANRHTRQLQEVEGRNAREVKALLEFHSQSTMHLESLIKALGGLPAPQVQVTIPENAIQVKQLPSEVHIESPQVFVPPDSIRVNVEQSTPQVVISDKAFSIVIDQPAAQVSVNVPQPRLVTKHIQYDDYGRPMHIEEREI